MSAPQATTMTAQAMAWLDLFLDIVHGDVVLGDAACREVGDALVDAYEPTLRSLVSSGALPTSLEKSLDTYCIRHMLLSAPELLLSSEEVADGLLQLAQRLREQEHGARLASLAESTAPDAEATTTTEGSGSSESAARASPSLVAEDDHSLPALGRALENCINSLRKRLSTDQFARCINVLADVVSGYVEDAAASIEAEAVAQLEPGAPWRGPPSPQVFAYRSGVCRFAESAAQQRALRKRVREAALDQMAEELLFPSPPQELKAVSGEDASTISFADELRAAMGSPDHEDPIKRPAKVEEAATPPRAMRRLPTLDSSVVRGVKALEESLTPPLAQPTRISTAEVDASGSSTAAPAPEPSLVVVDITSSPHTPAASVARSGRGVQVAGTEISLLNLLDEADQSQPISKREKDSAQKTTAPNDAVENGTLSVREMLLAQGFREDIIDCVVAHAPEVRTYFLSATTGRFEPVVAKGFFE